MVFGFIKSIDIYGSKIDLNFQKREVYKTYFGGLLTIVVFCFFGLGCWFYGKELVLKEKPSVINFMRSVVQAEKIQIKGDELIFTLGMQVNGAVFNDPTIFTVKGYQEYLVYQEDQDHPGRRSKKLVRESREIVECGLENIKIDEMKTYFLETAELQKTYCFKENQEKEVYIEGDYDNPQFAQVYVYVEKCQNSTSTNIICQPIEVINEHLKESIVTMYIVDKIINPNDFKNPFQYKGVNQYALTYSSLPKELQLFFSNYYIYTDSGLLQEDIQEQRDFIFTEMKETIVQDNPNLVVRVLIRTQKQKEFLMQRRYQKIADIVAQIGGLLKLLTAFGALIAFPFARLYLRKAIVDEIFNFDIDQSPIIDKQESKESKEKIELGDEQRSKQNTKCLTSQEAKDSSISFYCSKKLQSKVNPVAKVDSQRRRNVIQEVKRLFSVTKQSIKYNFLHYFGHIFFPKTGCIKQKRALVENSVQKVLEKLDVLYILNKILEIDKLKYILLNEDQLKLFEFIPKPIISENDESNISISATTQKQIQVKTDSCQQRATSQSLQILKSRKGGRFKVYEHEKDETNKSLEAYFGLINIAKKKDRTEIDNTLIELIDPKIIDYFSFTVNESEQLTSLNKTITQPFIQLLSENGSPFQNYYKKYMRSYSNQYKQSHLGNETPIDDYIISSARKPTEQSDATSKTYEDDEIPDKTIRPSFSFIK